MRDLVFRLDDHSVLLWPEVLTAFVNVQFITLGVEDDGECECVVNPQTLKAVAC
jgi:hypothetical protein